MDDAAQARQAKVERDMATIADKRSRRRKEMELLVYLNKIKLWIDEANSRANPSAARRLMEHYCQYIDSGLQPPGIMLQWVAEAFARTLEGKSFEQASGLRGGRGKSKKYSRDVDLWSLGSRVGSESRHHKAVHQEEGHRDPSRACP